MTGQAQALTLIDTSTSWSGSDTIGPFGQPNTATFGQTLTVPGGDTVLDGFSFLLQQNSASAIQFAGYVMAWDGSKATGPILYQSGPQATTQWNVFEQFNFATGGLNLAAGQQYVAFISASDFPTSGFGNSGAPFGDPYPGGGLVYQNNGSNFAQLTTSNWNNLEGRDLVFKASFSAPTSIPTPALLPGLIGMGIAALRKRKGDQSEVVVAQE
jgi:hypothetical protein